jgi:FHA domain-containing protein
VTETGLLIAEGVFLLLLYLFVWSVIRSSSKEIRRADVAPPVARAEPEPPPRRVEPAPAPPPVAAPAPPPPAAPAPPPIATVPAAAAVGAPPRPRERITGPVFDLASNLRPRLVVQESPTLERGREHLLEGGITIGRSASSQLSLPDAFVSHMHARIFRRGQFFFIEDLGSTNGTYLNDRRIAEETQLKVHDEVRLGETVLRYEE